MDNKQVIDKINHAIENQITACFVELRMESSKRSRERVTVVQIKDRPLYREVYLDYNKSKPKRTQKLLFTAEAIVTTVAIDQVKVNVEIVKYKIS